MENRRVFARIPCRLIVSVKGPAGASVGEIRNIGLGGLQARLPRRLSENTQARIAPNFEGATALTYEVCWTSQAGGSYDIGFRYPESLSGFWFSWAADLLAGADLTNSEVMERRQLVRLACSLKAELQAGQGSFVGDVLDIGAGGALVESMTELEPGSRVKLTIGSPVRVGNLEARIARRWEGSPLRYGLEFVNLRERHRLALVRLLDLLLRRES
ncbi:MAG: PilZ domain-containing protein [Candidatus Eremiobacteraeota bacterium]|nr:PilZ domain-containing protein [Candidatus Eremiobacteraeota bacterium]